jgi:hypothetical protein
MMAYYQEQRWEITGGDADGRGVMVGTRNGATAVMGGWLLEIGRRNFAL